MAFLPVPRTVHRTSARYVSNVKNAAHFCSSPWSVIREILELADVGPAEVVYDLASGDGRIPILAAQEFGCRAVGIEFDRDLFEYSEWRNVCESSCLSG